MKIDVSKTPIENLIAQIKLDNPLSTLSAPQFTAGVPVVAAGAAGRNTELTLTGVPGNGKSGTKLLSYTRLTVAQGQTVPVTSVEVVGADDEAATLAKIVLALGLIASEVVSSNYIAPVDASTDGLITIAGKPGSITYLPTTVDITVVLSDISLEDDIPNGELGGFEPA